MEDEDNLVLDGIELFIVLESNKKITESDIGNIEINCPLETQIQKQEMKNSGWRFDKINSMTIYSFKTTKMNGSSILCEVSVEIFSYIK